MIEVAVEEKGNGTWRDSDYQQLQQAVGLQCPSVKNRVIALRRKNKKVCIG
jgi:hypothetical protein